MISAFLLPLAALPAAAAGTYALARFRPGRAVAQPSAERWHREPTPTLGGVAIAAGLAIAYALLVAGGALPFDLRLAGFLAGLAVVFAVGLLDDLHPLPAWAKLGGQLAAVALVVATGTVIELVANDWIAYPLTVLWLVGVTNAFNLLDNMDGLAGLVALVAAGLFAASSVLDGNAAVAGLAAALAFACLGFLPFNLRARGRAAIFMGDSGSQLLGFSLAVIALLSNWRGASNAIAAILVPLFLLAVPILDTALVMLVRLREGRPLHRGGRDHSSHRLVGHGLSERRAVVVLGVLAALVGTATLALVHVDRPFLTTTGLCLAVALLVRFEIFLAGLQRLDGPPRRRSRVVAFLARHRRRPLELALDALLVTGAYALAYAVRFQGPEEQWWWDNVFWKSLPIVIAVKLAAFAAFGLYRGLWRHAGFHDLVSVAYAVLASEVVLIALLTMSGRFAGYSRSVFVIDALLSTAFVAVSRLGERWIEDLLSTVRGAAGARRILVVGAGRSGISLLRELRETPGQAVVGFLDDDPEKQGLRIQRVPILGSLWNVGEAIEKVRADTVVVTIPRAPRETLTHVVAACEASGIACRFAMRDHDLDPEQFLAAAR